MGYYICKYEEFIDALKNHNWDVNVPFIQLDNYVYDYEYDSCIINWVFFINEDEKIKIEIGCGLWDDYVDTGRTYDCGGILVESFWIKPNGNVICYSLNSPVLDYNKLIPIKK